MANYSDIFPLNVGGSNIAGFNWTEKTANFTAVANEAYYCDTALGDILMTLPSNPNPGDEVAFLIIGANALNITTNGNIKSAPLTTDFAKTITENYLMVIWSYIDGTVGWDWDARYDSVIGSAYIGAGDPHFNNVVLFLKGDGINGSTNIVDSSLTPKTISVFGDTQISTAQSKYGGGSIYFDGAGDYLTVPSSADWQFGTGDFTIEGWFNIPSLKSENGFYRRVLISQYQGSSAGVNMQIQGTSTSVSNSMLFCWGDSILINAPISNILGDFVHLAVSKASGVLKGFVGGIEVASVVDSTNFNVSNTLFIGRLSNSISFWDFGGNQDSLRITKGVGRYTTNFNPETDTFLNL